MTPSNDLFDRLPCVQSSCPPVQTPQSFQSSQSSFTRLAPMQKPCKYLSPLSILTPLHFFFFFLQHLTITISSNSPAPYSPVDNVLLNCGASGNSTALDGREWIGDIDSNFYPSLEFDYTSEASKAPHQASSVDRVPYMTARIFWNLFTYTFQVSPGQKFIRLYFYPASYEDSEMFKAFFSVKAGPYTLLNNFNASLTADSLGLESFVKEFCINIEENQRILSITIVPSTSTSGDSTYAFINGIEIVSMPTQLYYTSYEDLDVPVIGQGGTFQIINNSTALEMVHRLNIGGSSISPIKDSGMFRGWSQDTNYLLQPGVVPVNTTIRIRYTRIPAYTAPVEVYQTARSMGLDKEVNKKYNLTWKLHVDSGFTYLVRLHFCEIQPEITKIRDRVFYIYINNQTAEDSADVIRWSGGNGIPVYKDYAVDIERESHLFIALQPNADSKPLYSDAILNGLEVFKLSNYGNLAGLNPEVPVLAPAPIKPAHVLPTAPIKSAPVLAPAPIKPPRRSAKKSKIKKILFIAVGGGTIIGPTILSLLVSLFFDNG